MSKLKIGQRIRIEEVGTGKVAKKNKKRTGVIAAIYKSYIQVQLEHYKECITNADIIASTGLLITVKENGNWTTVTKEML